MDQGQTETHDPVQRLCQSLCQEEWCKKYVKQSPTVHVFTSGGTKKYTNPKGLKLKKTKITLKKGKKYKIRVSVSKQRKGRQLVSARHVPMLRYVSTNTKVAKVSKAGTIKGQFAGSCNIYVYTANGICKKMKVTVK